MRVLRKTPPNPPPVAILAADRRHWWAAWATRNSGEFRYAGRVAEFARIPGRPQGRGCTSEGRKASGPCTPGVAGLQSSAFQAYPFARTMPMRADASVTQWIDR